jgi:hypothetical protein
MASLVQDPRLSIRALAISGDNEAQDGVHLRWSFAPELGFPPAGFELSVRASRERNTFTARVGAAAASVASDPPPGLATDGVTVHSADGLALDIGSRCGQQGLALSQRRVLVRFRPAITAPPGLVREVTLAGVSEGGVATARALHAGRVAACGVAGDNQPSPCKRYELTLRADAIDTIEVTGNAALLMTVTWMPLAADEATFGWKPLTKPICLPVTSSISYPCPDPGVEPEEVAKSRLPDPAELPPGAPTFDELSERLLGDAFGELRKTLEVMLDRTAVEPQHLQVEELDPDEPDPAGFRLQPLQQVLLGALDPYLARILGLYHVDKLEQGQGPLDYKVEAVWPVEGDKLTLSWIVFGQDPGPQPPLAAPGGVTATAFEGAAHVEPDGTVDPHQMDVGVRWTRPSACDLTRPELAAAAWLIERTAAGAPPDGPYELVSRREFEEGAKPEPTPVVLTESHTPLAPFQLGMYVDRRPGYGTLHYRVRARDLFGRTSGPSAPAAVDVHDLVPPGAPLNLAADHVEPDDPERAGSAALAWANRDTPPGAAQRAATLVRWTWPVGRQRQAPDADEFRLYFRRGPLNAVSGSVRTVTPLGGDRFLVHTDLPAIGPDFPTAPAPVDLGVLRNEGEEYPIQTMQLAPGGLSLTVTGPPASPPLPGRCALRFGTGRRPLPPHPAWRSFREPADWGGLVLGPGPQAPLRIGLDAVVRSPLPAALGSGDVEVTRGSEPDPAAGGTHLHYELKLRGLELAPTAERPRAQGSFGISAADDASPANESRVSAPAGIFAVHRSPPEIPTLTLPEEIFASPADWHGHSWYTLTWPARRGVGYLVYRASDAELLQAAGVSMAAHRALPPAQQRQQLRELGSRQANTGAFSPVNPEPVWATADGPASWLDQLDGTLRNRFVYRLRSIDRAGNLAPWPPDSAPAHAGEVAVVVAVPPATPPSPPRWAGLEPTDDGLALHWVPSPEADLAGYRLYRAGDPEAAGDPRSMTPLLAGATPEGEGGLVAVRVTRGTGPSPTIEVEQLPAGDASPDRLIRYLDTTVEGGRGVWYRLVAEDAHGNRSLPSEVLATRFPKRHPPAPPGWVSAGPVTGGVELTWSAVEDDLEPLVLRRRPDDPLWQPLGPWLPRGTSTFLDTSVEADTTYEYLVRVRDRVGHVISGPVQTVTLPP